jgi:hypothetical protein
MGASDEFQKLIVELGLLLMMLCVVRIVGYYIQQVLILPVSETS